MYTLIYKVNPDSSIEWAKSIDSSNETLIVNSGIDSSTYNTTKLEMDKRVIKESISKIVTE